jgi:hypothetical protein
MYLVLRPDKDTYITDRVIKGVRVVSGNVGSAGSLDLFKLYGNTYVSGSVSSGSLVVVGRGVDGATPNVELSRLLIHYDLNPLRELVDAGKVDPGNASFRATLKLFDVYGGQPTPANFTVAIYPLSRSFDEGLGKDVVYYADRDSCNFLTGSRAQGIWLASGCGLGGTVTGSVDYFTSLSTVATGSSLKRTQVFVTGEEDLEIDVTTLVSATIANLLPDEGFRISLESTLEHDTRSYFVKRFASRTAFNEDKRPRLNVTYDDSIQNDVLSLEFDSPSYLFLHNYVRQAPANLSSGSALTAITGQNSLILKLTTEISGGWYTVSFSGSQHTNGIFPVAGVYSSSVTLSSTNSVFASKLAQSGSVKFIPIWGSIDGTVAYHTGTAVYAYTPSRGSQIIDDKRLTVSVHGVKESYFSDETPTFRANLFDISSPSIRVSRLPVDHPGVVIRDVHYQIRDDVNGIIEIPFDTVKNSTRLSSDANGMYFKFDMSNLVSERSYVIDILVIVGTSRRVYKSASPIFRVSDSR